MCRENALARKSARSTTGPLHDALHLVVYVNVCVQARMKENEREGMVDGVGKGENGRKDTQRLRNSLLACSLADVRASAYRQAKKIQRRSIAFLASEENTQPKEAKVNL